LVSSPDYFPKKKKKKKKKSKEERGHNQEGGKDGRRRRAGAYGSSQEGCRGPQILHRGKLFPLVGVDLHLVNPPQCKLYGRETQVILRFERDGGGGESEGHPIRVIQLIKQKQTKNKKKRKLI